MHAVRKFSISPIDKNSGQGLTPGKRYPVLTVKQNGPQTIFGVMNNDSLYVTISGTVYVYLEEDVIIEQLKPKVIATGTLRLDFSTSDVYATVIGADESETDIVDALCDVHDKKVRITIEELNT